MSSSSNKLGTHTQYTDGALVQLTGPDGTIMAYQYDNQQRSFFIREAALTFTGKHGSTHISTDPIPSATCTTPGLMAADDKCRLDAIVGTRVGVLGFQGAGFPDDGGFIQGDIILAAGNEMISLERVGQVVRFTVDVPTILSCGNEDCLQIFWVQDETDIAAIRPPVSGGRLLGENLYGELKIFLFPENTVVNPANPAATLNNKAFYPSLIFKRYDDGTGTNEGEIDLVLKRNSSGTATVGWAFTPGATGKPELQYFLGTDTDGTRIAFKFDGQSTPGMLGALLYNGTAITKRSAIITGYDTTVVTSNIYKVQWWNVHTKTAIGTEFSITNQSSWDKTNGLPILDSASDALLPIGQIVDVFSVQIGTSNGEPVYVHYCRENPTINASSLWTTLGAIQFGDTLEGIDGLAATASDIRTYESSQWGITGLHAITLLNSGTPIEINSAYDAVIDQITPALTVSDNPGTETEYRRPVTIWNRQALRDAYLEFHFARPVPVDVTDTATKYPPMDILLRAPIDSLEVKYAYISGSGSIGTGDYAGKTYCLLSGITVEEIPPTGLIRVVNSGGSYDSTFGYVAVMKDAVTGHAAIIMDSAAPGSSDIVEIMHEDYKSPALRLQFTFLQDHDLTLQPQVGILNPTSIYNSSDTNVNDYVGAMEAGYTVGSTHWQDGSTSSGTSGITVNPEGFVCYTGTGTTGGDEVFNVLQILVVDSKCWVWWNGLLMSPNTADSAILPTPVDVTTPYFPLPDVVQYGKFGVRLFPGSKLRRFIIKSRPSKHSEFSYGQVEVS